MFFTSPKRFSPSPEGNKIQVFKEKKGVLFSVKGTCLLSFSLLLALFAFAFQPFFVVAIQAHNTSTTSLPKQTWQLGEQTLALQVPQTLQQYQDGLMYRKQLAANEGMLFLYLQPQITHFWMQHCKISLDFVYGLNQNVVGFAENVPPCLGKGNDCPIYSSPTPASWVLELPAGSVKRFKLKTGTTLKRLL